MEVADEAVEEEKAAAPAPVTVVKNYNDVNDDGSYTFGYETSDGAFKIETKDIDGSVKGMKIKIY